MTLGRLLLDLWLALVVLSLAAVVLITLAWIVLALVTVASARRRERRRPATSAFEWLSEAYPEDDLAEIDEALEAILAQERPGALTWRG